MGRHTGQVIGYLRVSAADPNQVRQLAALGPMDRLFSEKVSGKNTAERVQIQEMLINVREGDTVRVKSPDRLARSTTNHLALVEQLKAKGIALEFIDNPALNTDTPQGEFMPRQSRFNWPGRAFSMACPKPRWPGILASHGRRCTQR